MRKALPTASLAALLAVFTVGPVAVHAQDTSDLLGRWLVTSWTSPDGEVDSTPPRGLFIFTDSNYSMIYVRGDGPRAQWSEDPTDAELLEALSSIVSNAGRYSVEGDQITYWAYVALNPNYMAQWPENDVTVTYKIEDGVLSLTWTSGMQSGWTATLGRPSQAGG